MKNKESFIEELKKLLNQHCIERDISIPDYILNNFVAEHLGLTIVKQSIEKIATLAYITSLAAKRGEIISDDTHCLMRIVTSICEEIKKYTDDWMEKKALF